MPQKPMFDSSEHSRLIDFVNAAYDLLDTIQDLGSYDTAELATIAFKLGTRPCRDGYVRTQYALLGFSQELTKGYSLDAAYQTMARRAVTARLARQLADPNYKYGR